MTAASLHGIFTGDLRVRSSNLIVLDVARQIGGPEPSTTTLTDLSGFGNDGAMTDVTWSQLPSGLWVMVFNGSSSVVSLTNYTIFGNKPGSINFWWKSTGWTYSYETLFCASHGGGWDDQVVQIGRFAETDDICLNITDGVNYTGPDTRKTVTENAWHQTVGTWDGTTAIHYYDGAFGNSDPAAYYPSDNATSIRIGNGYVTGTRWFGGSMALLKAYNYAFTPAEVSKQFSDTRSLLGV